MNWIAVVRRLQAIAQTGLAYSRDPYDIGRFHALQEVTAEIAAATSDSAADEAAAIFSLEKGYATPKVDVRGVVFDAGRILLVRERTDGLWSVPGGWADIGETPGECAAKEVREESGYIVRPTKLLAVLDRDRHDHPPMLWHVYKIFIRCEVVGRDAPSPLETDAAEFFGRDQLPPLSTSRVTADEIAQLFRHLDDPSLPADFD